MLFAIAEDGMVSVLDSEGEACAAFEGIDVENGVFAFYAEDGSSLVPQFNRPNKRILFGLILENGKYELVHAATGNSGDDAFEVAIAEARGVEPNAHFRTVSEIREYVEARRRGNGPVGRNTEA